MTAVVRIPHYCSAQCRASHRALRQARAPRPPEHWTWTARQLLHDLSLLAGAVLAVLFIAAVLWLPALLRGQP